MTLAGLSVGLVGPLPPPAGGMANQTVQLAELLRREGAIVTVVQTNAPVFPRIIDRIRGVRGLFRLVPYAMQVWSIAGRADVLHIMANSGWSWHLVAAPAIWIARMRGAPTVVNYRGGEAATFLARSAKLIRHTLRRADVLAVPSGFLNEVFGRFGMRSEIVPNIIDLERFHPAAEATRPNAPHFIVARNLEAIYDIPTALRAFALVREEVPAARMTIAGTGPDRAELEKLCATLDMSGSVTFSGRLERDEMARLYRVATAVVNPSRVDNMPNSVLEAMASGVPVVSTNVGGVPFVLRDGVTGLLVNAGDHVAMAHAMRRILDEEALTARLRGAALADVQQYAWPRVRERWADVYSQARSHERIEASPA
jgi:glycosyltransferase involved in cell wall biosynthesis